MSVILELEREQIKAVTAQRNVPEFAPGDTVKVMVKVMEGSDVDAKDAKAKAKAKDRPKEAFRLQAYEGVVIARSGASFRTP